VFVVICIVLYLILSAVFGKASTHIDVMEVLEAEASPLDQGNGNDHCMTMPLKDGRLAALIETSRNRL
jgi:hypothetical protein